jgi:uncharacterized protein (TIGR03437 family)
MSLDSLSHHTLLADHTGQVAKPWVPAISENASYGNTRGFVRLHAPTMALILFLIGIAAVFTPMTWAQGYTIRTVAGGGSCCSSGSGLATQAYLGTPQALAVDASGNLYIACYGSNSCGGGSILPTGGVAKVSSNGTLTTVASAFDPTAIAVDRSGDIYLGDLGTLALSEISPAGKSTTITSVTGRAITGVAIDNSGNLFYTSAFGVSKIQANGLTSVVNFGPAGSYPMGLAVDSNGNLYVAAWLVNQVFKVDTNGNATVVAGVDVPGSITGSYSGDGGPSINANLNGPDGVAVDAAGNVFIADTGNNRIRKVDPNGIITTIAGTGGVLLSGDGGPGIEAGVDAPSAIAVAPTGVIYITDPTHGIVRALTPTGSNSPPVISADGIVPVSGTAPTIQPGEWVSIYGSNISDTTATWTGTFPRTLGGTSVAINGKDAYLSYVSPEQINLQAPDDSKIGSVRVVVTTTNGSTTSTVTLAEFAPSFFLRDSKHVAGIISRTDGSGAYGGGTYDIIGPTGTSLGYPTVAAKAGDNVELFGTGFGPTNPAVLAGQSFSGAASTTNPVTTRINNLSVVPTFAGLSGAGVYQLNITIPPGLGAGDVPLVAEVGGVKTQLGVVISLQ